MHATRLKSKLANIRDTIVFELIFVVLALVSVTLLGYEAFGDATPAQIQTIVGLDFWIACVFLTDFFVGLIITDNRKRYLWQNWYLLLASIPINEYAFRSLRLLRILRILRIISALSRTLYIRESVPAWLRNLRHRFSRPRK